MGTPSVLDPERFYRDVLWALGEHARRKGATAQGAAVVVKRIAKEHGLAIADRVPLPRLSRSQLAEQGRSNSGYRHVISEWKASSARPKAGADAPDLVGSEEVEEQ
jgi:hypothetical protein